MAEVNLYNTYCDDESRYCSIKKNPNQAEIIELCNINKTLITDISTSLVALKDSEIGLIDDINLFIILNNVYSVSIDKITSNKNILEFRDESTGKIIEFFYDYMFYSDKAEIKIQSWLKRLSFLDNNRLKTKISDIMLHINKHLEKAATDNFKLFLEKYFKLILAYNKKCQEVIKNLKNLNLEPVINMKNQAKIKTLLRKSKKAKLDNPDDEESQEKFQFIEETSKLFKSTRAFLKEFDLEKSLTEEFAPKMISNTSLIIDKILEPFSDNSDFVFNICSGSRIDMLLPVFVLKHITQKLENEEAESINKFSIISFCRQEYNQHESVLDSGTGNISFNSILFQYLNNDDNIISIIRTYNPGQNITDENKLKLVSIIRNRLNIYYIPSRVNIEGVFNFFFPILYNKLYQKQLIIENQPIFIHIGFAQDGNYDDKKIGKMLYFIKKEYNLVFYATNFIVFPNKGLYMRTMKYQQPEICKIDGKSCYPNLNIENKDYNDSVYTIFTKDAVAEFYE